MQSQQPFTQTASRILCCSCGVSIPANPAAMCMNCIKNEVDITADVPKQGTISFCRGCSRYLQPPNNWVVCDLESKELMMLLLKRIKGLEKGLRLVDVGWVWTEPHSKRLKLKLTVQKEVFTGTVIQQIFVVEFVVTGEQCRACSQYEAKDTWNTVVQVRQRVDHKKTFFWLEQLILKHNAHAQVTNILESSDGIDFYFSNPSHARKMVEFFSGVVPIRVQHSKKLKSRDIHTGSSSYRFTYMVEIAPVCREDLVLVPRQLAVSLGGVNPLLLCSKVTSKLRLLDPFSLKALDVQANAFWQNPVKPVMNASRLQMYYVIDVTRTGVRNAGYVQAEVELMRDSDVGVSDETFTVLTHLGALLKCGDYVLGYDTAHAVFAEPVMRAMKGKEIPHTVLVKKAYPHRRRRRKARHWQLQELVKEKADEMGARRKMDIEREEQQYEEFLNELEEDPELRSAVNLYKKPNAEEIFVRNQARDMVEDSDEDYDDDDDGDFPEVQLTELLDGLSINAPSQKADEFARHTQEK